MTIIVTTLYGAIHVMFVRTAVAAGKLATDADAGEGSVELSSSSVRMRVKSLQQNNTFNPLNNEDDEEGGSRDYCEEKDEDRGECLQMRISNSAEVPQPYQTWPQQVASNIQPCDKECDKDGDITSHQRRREESLW